MRLLYHRDNPTSTGNRLVSGDLLQFVWLKRSGNVVLNGAVRAEVLGKIIEHELHQPRWEILRHVAKVFVVNRGLAAL